MALIAGKEHRVDELRRTAVSRRDYWAEVQAADEAKAEERRRAEAIWAEHQAIIDRLEAEARAPKPAPDLRIRRL